MNGAQVFGVLCCLGFVLFVFLGFEVAVFRISCALCKVPQPGVARTFGIVFLLLVIPAVVDGVFGGVLIEVYKATEYPLWEAGLVQFFLALPKDLGEAARVDGCPEFRIFWKIYLPLCRPALATLAVFTFVAGWNGFLWPLIVLNDPDMNTIQMSLAAFSFNRQTDYGPLMAGSIVAMAPTLLLFAFAQRHLTRGLAFTGSGLQ